MSACEEWTCSHVVVPDQPDEPPGFHCPQCGKVLRNPNDLRHGWCDSCKQFTTEPHGPLRS